MVFLVSALRKFIKVIKLNIAKGTTDPRVEFISQDYSSQFTNLEHITISESLFKKKIQPNMSIPIKSKVI